MAALSFDANNVQPQTDFEPLPAGDYLVTIIDSAMETMKSGNGEMLKLSLQVLDGPAANRLLWDRLSLVHNNPQVVEIAQRKLSAICHAVNVLQLTDSAQLHSKPLLVRVKYKEGDGQYGPKNEIASYKPASAPRQAPASAPAKPAAPTWTPPPQPAAPAAQAPAWTPPQAPAQQPAAADPGTPPWEAQKAA